MMYGKKVSTKTMSKPKKSKSFPDVNKDVLMAKGIIPKKKKK